MPGLDLPTRVSGVASGGRATAGGGPGAPNATNGVVSPPHPPNNASFAPYVFGSSGQAGNINVTVGSADANKQPDAEIRKFRKKYRQEILTAAMWGWYTLYPRVISSSNEHRFFSQSKKNTKRKGNVGKRKCVFLINNLLEYLG